MKTILPIRPAGIADLFSAANAAAEKPLKVTSTTMPTRQSAPLHKDRGDQAILVKWNFPPEQIERFMPRGIYWDGAVDQDRIEAGHAEYARLIGQGRKAVDDRIRDGAVDTADWKVESAQERGSISADALWEELEAHGFKLLRSHAYVSVRSSMKKGVVELRFVHESVYDSSRAALKAALEATFGDQKPRGVAPEKTRIEGALIGALRRMMSFQSAFCTVFSNTATADPTITVNFRGQMNSRGPRQIFELKDGVYSFRTVA